MAKKKLGSFLLALALTGGAFGGLSATMTDDDMETKRTETSMGQFTTATYRVSAERQAEFLELLKGAEATMREENLISPREVYRMRSLDDPELILEVFEWVDSTAFGRAQQNPRILEWWRRFEETWKEGGFGLCQFPESQQPWAQFKSIE